MPVSPSPSALRQARIDLEISIVTREEELPADFGRAAFIQFLHEQLGEYRDPKSAIEKAVEYALSSSRGKGGFLLTARRKGRPVGGAVVLETGMSDFIPEYILVYLAVDAAYRGEGIGGRLVETVSRHCDGDVALHVEYDNPARRLYERAGFTSRYAEMRLHR